MRQVSHFIGRHLPQPVEKKSISQCVFCGAISLAGWPVTEAIKDGFADMEMVGAGDGVCTFCLACLGRGQQRKEFLRNQSFICTREALQRLRREELWQYLLTPPEEEFVFCVSYGSYKHLFLRAPINSPGQRPFFVQTEKGLIDLWPERLTALIIALQNWYSLIPGKEETWFSKSDILSGPKLARIIRYNQKRFWEEEQLLKPRRRTALLELLTYALNKGERSG